MAHLQRWRFMMRERRCSLPEVSGHPSACSEAPGMTPGVQPRPVSRSRRTLAPAACPSVFAGLLPVGPWGAFEPLWIWAELSHAK